MAAFENNPRLTASYFYICQPGRKVIVTAKRTRILDIPASALRQKNDAHCK